MAILGVNESVEKELVAIAENNKIEKLYVFGSRARGDYKRTSSVMHFKI